MNTRLAVAISRLRATWWEVAPWAVVPENTDAAREE